ncbi:MAG TPA: hypothetical protein VJB57_18790 [Dehalococcoidia bacterium]|nr:hypothetical protein [Dehalococcoidia bacterium]
MPIFNTFSKRTSPKQPQPYQYKTLPKELRNQIIHIWRGTIGFYVQVDSWNIPPASNLAWKSIHDTLARERGLLRLHNSEDDPFRACARFLLESDAEAALDVIDLSFQVINTTVRNWTYDDRQYAQVSQTPSDAIDELNHRLREHNLGFEFVGGQLITVDSEYVHNQVVAPALAVLHDLRFAGALEEFTSAHRHYREGRYKEAINDALKAFESTMKTIADRRHWHYDSTVSAQGLIDVMFKNGLVPTELTSQFSSLRSLLESGSPTLRNRKSAHGQGSEPMDVPGYLAAYALNLAASNILLLVRASGAS